MQLRGRVARHRHPACAVLCGAEIKCVQFVRRHVKLCAPLNTQPSAALSLRKMNLREACARPGRSPRLRVALGLGVGPHSVRIVRCEVVTVSVRALPTSDTRTCAMWNDLHFELGFG